LEKCGRDILALAMYVIGTSGHVDHGKSTLVKALTGIDPDRLEEEKRRGLTIDLGFAWFKLPSGREVSIVDVPGHERFVRNMLAGVGGIDLALLIVAADESVMPQTKEHLAILDLLNIGQGLIVVSKRDLVEPEMLELVELEIEEALRGTVLHGARSLFVSAVNGDGMKGLISAIDESLDQIDERIDLKRPRLAVDRAFTIPGFGTVATGTLIDGTFHVGQEIELAHSGRRARIRGLQTHGETVQSVGPGSRAAVNISGLAIVDIVRGEILTLPGWLRPTKAIDAKVRALHDMPRPLRHNHRLTLHAYTSETPVTLRLLGQNELSPGQEALAQVWLENPVALVAGDRFVLRSSNGTVGGGIVIDVGAPRHRRRREAILNRLETRAQGGPIAQFVSVLGGRDPSDVASLARRANIADDQAIRLAREAGSQGLVVSLGSGEISLSTFLFTIDGWFRLSARCENILNEFHAQHKLRAGMFREELRSRAGLASQLGNLVIQKLLIDGLIEEQAGAICSKGYRVMVSIEQQKLMDQYLDSLAIDPFPADAPTIDGDLLTLLLDQGKIVRLAEGIFTEAVSYQRLIERVTGLLHEQGKVTVAEIRDFLHTSRKYAMALLEHMDEELITRRIGDERVLLRR
jgi:selenocysteine-specific elongation factor